MGQAQQFYILVCGPNGSGKTFFSKKLQEQLSDFEYINADPMREFLRGQYGYYADVDYSLDGENYKKRSAQRIVRKYVEYSTGELAKSGLSMIHDSVALRKTTRQFRVEHVQHFARNIVPIVIGMNMSEEVLMQRLEVREQADKQNTQWVQKYKEVMKDTYELPQPLEQNHVFLVDEHNFDDVIAKVVKLVTAE